MQFKLYFLTFLQLIFSSHCNELERQLDLSHFGPCVLHLKSFKDDITTSDLTANVIRSQFRGRTQPLVSVYNSNSSHNVAQITPNIRIREPCSLQVILGYRRQDEVRLESFIKNSNYTYTVGSLNPYSTFILIPTVLNEGGISIVLEVPYFITLPIRIFLLVVRNMQGFSQNVSKSYYFICFFCKLRFQGIQNTSAIATITTQDFRNDWISDGIHLFFTPSLPSDWDISGCWTKSPTTLFRVGGRYGTKTCIPTAIYFDLLTHTVDQNITAILWQRFDPSHRRFSGYSKFRESVGHSSNYRDSVSVSFVTSGNGYLYYIDCEMKSNQLSFKAWTASFDNIVWLSLFVSVFILPIILSLKLSYNSMKKLLLSYAKELFTATRILLRQGPFPSRPLVITCSISIFFFLSNYENYMTSDLIVPLPKNPMSVKELLATGYYIGYVGLSRLGSKIGFGDKAILEDLKKIGILLPQERLIPITSVTMSNPSPHENGDKNAFYVEIPEEDVSKFIDKHESINPPYCKFFQVQHQFRSTSAFNSYEHTFRTKFLIVQGQLIQAGIVGLFTRNLPLYISHQIKVRSHRSKPPETINDNYISEKTLSLFSSFTAVYLH
jgi:hypothetical protein